MLELAGHLIVERSNNQVASEFLQARKTLLQKSIQGCRQLLRRLATKLLLGNRWSNFSIWDTLKKVKEWVLLRYSPGRALNEDARGHFAQERRDTVVKQANDLQIGRNDRFPGVCRAGV